MTAKTRTIDRFDGIIPLFFGYANMVASQVPLAKKAADWNLTPEILLLFLKKPSFAPAREILAKI
jgi:hypothetical protein